MKNLFLMMLIIIPSIARATQDDWKGITILGMSENQELIAVKEAGYTAAGEFESVLVIKMKSGELDRKFIIINEIANEDIDEKKVRQEAEAHLRSMKINEENFTKNFAALKKISPHQSQIRKDVYLQMESRTYGDKIALIIHDKHLDIYKMLYTNDNNTRDVCQYLPEDMSFEEKMQYLHIENAITASFQNKEGKLVVILNKKYEMMGTHSSARLEILNPDLEITEYKWSNTFGYRLYKKKLYKEAIERFKESIVLKPDYAVALYNCACTYALLNEDSQAVEYLEKLYVLWTQNKDKAAKMKLDKIKSDSDFNLIRESKSYSDFIVKLNERD